MKFKICPKCKLEYRNDFLTCSDCNVLLIEINKPEKEVNWLSGFGVISAKKAISILFYIGFLPILYSAIFFGRYIYLTNKYFKDISFIENGVKTYTQIEANNSGLGVLFGIIFFVSAIFLWKIICELLIIIFRCFEVYVEKNSVKDKAL